jgi:hypothetical protein
MKEESFSIGFEQREDIFTNHALGNLVLFFVKDHSLHRDLGQSEV